MNRALALAAAAACLLCAGCGSAEDGTVTAPGAAVTTVSTPDATGPEPEGERGGSPDDDPAPAPSIPDSDPAATLATYFDDLAAGDEEAAWALLSPSVREQFGGYETWSAGLEQRLSSTLAAADPAGGPEDEPAFEVEVDTVERAPCEVTAERTFTGSWSLEPDPADPGSWRIASAEQTLVAGPPDLETLCTTGTTGTSADSGY